MGSAGCTDVFDGLRAYPKTSLLAEWVERKPDSSTFFSHYLLGSWTHSVCLRALLGTYLVLHSDEKFSYGLEMVDGIFPFSSFTFHAQY